MQANFSELEYASKKRELVFYFKDLATPIERPSNGLCQTDAALQGVIVLLTGTIWELINIAPFKD